MVFRGKNVFNTSFDAFADNYHSVRPGYPTQVFKDIGSQCELDENSRLLEIGAGSGIATVDLAKFGCHVSAIEPGSHLAAIAKTQTREFDKVEIFEGTFEDFRANQKFDAVAAFTAFHWLNREDKYREIANLLEDSGHLVLVWNSFCQSDTAVSQDINSAYRQFLPDIYPEESTVSEVNEGTLSKLNRREQEVITNPFFYPIFLRKYLTVHRYNNETYPKLLNTFPKIAEVEEVKRLNFLEQVSKIVAQHGEISVPVLTTLIVCRKRDDFLKMLGMS